MKTSVWVAALFFAGINLVAGTAAATELFKPWMDGTSDNEPILQVQRLDADTFVMRQSFHATVQAPFLYLLFGADRALLLDTGDGGGKILPTINAVISDWLAARGRKNIPLVVAHSHSHSDHHTGDIEFTNRPLTTVVGLRPGDVASFFNIAHWPNDIVPFDLGGRILYIIPAPGHEPAHIVLYDSRLQMLLSGDVLLPGHVLIPFDKIETFRDSINRIQMFLADKSVAYILGTHIEMTREPGMDYPFGAPSHPNEHVLALPASALDELQAGLRTLGDSQEAQVHNDFIILPVPPQVMKPYEFHG